MTDHITFMVADTIMVAIIVMDIITTVDTNIIAGIITIEDTVTIIKSVTMPRMEDMDTIRVKNSINNHITRKVHIKMKGKEHTGKWM